MEQDENIKSQNESWHRKSYNSLIERAKIRGLNKNKLEGYYEKHHILPKCLGGTNTKDNLVLLTAREHMIAHMLLQKMYPDNHKILNAVIALLSPGNESQQGERVIVSTRVASYYRRLFSESLKGKHHSEETKRKISEGNKGRIIPKEQIEYLRKINTGRKHTEETRKKMSESHKRENLSPETIEKFRRASTGRKHSLDSLKKISKSHKGKVFTEEHRKNLSKSKSGKPGKRHTKEDLLKMSENSPHKKKIIGPNNEIYKSIKECAFKNSICRDTLRKWINKHPEKGFRYYKE